MVYYAYFNSIIRCGIIFVTIHMPLMFFIYKRG
jgi:hypothetical protein